MQALVVTPAPDDSARYVMASSLNLRDEAGAKKDRLAINTELKVLQQDGDRSQVGVANGSEGWVATEYPLLQVLKGSYSALESLTSAKSASLRPSSLSSATRKTVFPALYFAGAKGCSLAKPSFSSP